MLAAVHRQNRSVYRADPHQAQGLSHSCALTVPVPSNTCVYVQAPASDGLRALVLSPTKELTDQIHRHFLTIAAVMLLVHLSAMPALADAELTGPTVGHFCANQSQRQQEHMEEPKVCDLVVVCSLLLDVRVLLSKDILIATPLRLIHALENSTRCACVCVCLEVFVH